MKKRGFTLIELLAVIVILAIIALIATPIVMNLIDKARKKSAEDSTYGLVEASKNFYAEVLMDSEGEAIEEMIFYCNGTNCHNSQYDKNLEFNGTMAKSGKITISKNGTPIIVKAAVINGYTCFYPNSEGKATCDKGEPEEKSVVLNLGNGNTETIRVMEYSTYSALNTIPTRENYVFLGWFTDENGQGIELTSETEIEEELPQNIYANWRKMKYNAGDTIMYNPVTGEKCNSGETGCYKFYVIATADSIETTTVPIMVNYNMVNTDYWSANNYVRSLTSTWKEASTARLITKSEVAAILGKYAGLADPLVPSMWPWLFENLPATSTNPVGYWILKSGGFESYAPALYYEFGWRYGDVNASETQHKSKGVRPVISVSKDKL